MKKINKLNLLLWIIGSIGIQQNTMAKLQIMNKESHKAVAATTHQHTVIKDLDAAIHEVFKKHAPLFTDLSILNVMSKVVEIENLRQDLLFKIKRAENSQRKHKSKLEVTLEKMDIKNKPREAIADFQSILKMIPNTTKELISSTIKDPFVKSFLGL